MLFLNVLVNAGNILTEQILETLAFPTLGIFEPDRAELCTKRLRWPF